MAMLVEATIWEGGKARNFSGEIPGTDVEAGIKAVRAEVGREPERIEVISSRDKDEVLAERKAAKEALRAEAAKALEAMATPEEAPAGKKSKK